MTDTALTPPKSITDWDEIEKSKPSTGADKEVQSYHRQFYTYIVGGGLVIIALGLSLLVGLGYALLKLLSLLI